MAPVTATQITNILKQFFTGKQAEEMIFGSKHRVLINMLSDRQTGGLNDPTVVYHEHGQGVAANFLVAQTNSGSPSFEQLKPTPPAEGLHGVLQIGSDALLRSAEDRGSFIRSQTWRFADVVGSLSNFVELCLLGDGTGVIGQVGNSSFATTSLTLADASDAVLFSKGQYVVFSLTSTGALLDGGQAIKVAGVNYSTGVITLEEQLDVIAGMAQNAYIFREGSASDGAAAGTVVPHGLASWIPISDPSPSEDFYGVDRSVNPTRLAGVRSTGALSDIYGSVNDHMSTMLSYGAEQMNTRALTSHQNVGRLAKQTQTQVQIQPGKFGQVGFSRVTINTPAGATEVYGSPFVKSNRLYTLDPSVMEIIRLGSSLVYIYDLDGQMMQRLPSSSGVEIRVESRPALKIRKPGECGVIVLS